MQRPLQTLPLVCRPWRIRHLHSDACWLCALWRWAFRPLWMRRMSWDGPGVFRGWMLMVHSTSEVASYRCELWSKPLLRWRELRTQRLSSTGMRTMSLKVLRCMAMLLRILLVLMASATMT